MSSSQSSLLCGDVVVITGASRGLGRATAEAFGARGSRVIVNYRTNESAATKAVDLVKGAHENAEAIAVQADVSDTDAVDTLFERVEDEYGRVDVFVHNAAVTAFKPLDEVTPEDVALTYDVGVTGFLRGSQRALELMPEGGRIVGVSGNDSHTYMPLHGLLASSKSAMETLVRYLAVEQAENGITVNAVNPGPIDKDNYYTSISEEIERAMADLVDRSPKGAVPPESVAESIVSIADPANEWVTGEVFHVDGGLSAL